RATPRTRPPAWRGNDTSRLRARRRQSCFARRLDARPLTPTLSPQRGEREPGAERRAGEGCNSGRTRAHATTVFRRVAPPAVSPPAIAATSARASRITVAAQANPVAP